MVLPQKRVEHFPRLVQEQPLRRARLQVRIDHPFAKRQSAIARGNHPG
jgi:hypothetical protein